MHPRQITIITIHFPLFSAVPSGGCSQTAFSSSLSFLNCLEYGVLCVVQDEGGLGGCGKLTGAEGKVSPALPAATDLNPWPDPHDTGIIADPRGLPGI